MDSKEIIEEYQSRFKKLSKYFQRLPGDFKADDIHQFRVEFKKLRAFIRLVNFGIDHQQKIPKSLKSFYDTAGKMRNLQLHQKNIHKLSEGLSLTVPETYLRDLRRQEKWLQKQAGDTAKNVSLRHFEKKLADYAPAGLTKKSENGFLQKNLSRLKMLLGLPFYYDETVHGIRKILKDLMYTCPHLKTELTASLPSALNQLKEMESLASRLGDFHDLCVELYLLNPLYSDITIAKDEIQSLHVLNQQLQFRKDEMRQEVINALLLLKQQVEEEQLLLANAENVLQ